MIYELLFFVAHNPLGHVRIQKNHPIFLYIIVISKPADNYLRAAHYLLYLLSLNGRAGQITRETNYLWVTISKIAASDARRVSLTINYVRIKIVSSTERGTK